MKSLINKPLITSYFSLFTSFGTIFCCALPSLFVTLGMGAVFAGIIGFFPQLIWLSKNKSLVFAVSAVLILVSLIIVRLQKNQPCPIDPQKAKACLSSRKWSARISLLSLVLWTTGALFAFVLPKFL